MPEPRRIAVLDGARRLDLALPPGGTVGDALDRAGLQLDGQRVPFDDAGRPADLTRPVADLADGALLAVVDLTEPAPEQVRDRGAAAHDAPGELAPWWLMAALAVPLVVLLRDAVGARAVWAVVVLAGCALVGAVVAARRPPVDGAGRAARVAGPAALAVAAVVAALPGVPAGGAQLVVLTGCLAAGLLLVVTVVADPEARSRGALGAAAVVLLASALVWAVVLFAGWGPQVAAAVTVGAVPLALRALPSTLLDVPDGYFIDYEASMGTRWSIRGRVPADPGPVDGAGIGGQVQVATAARTSGTLVLSVLGAVSLPFAVPAEPAGGLALGARIALLICYATAMTLLARSVGVRGLHWAPRGSAAVAVVVGARLALDTLPATGAALAACAALLAGLVVAGLVVLVGRGARSLVLSRTADVAETLTIALSLPAGLLAGDLIDHLRALVAA